MFLLVDEHVLLAPSLGGSLPIMQSSYLLMMVAIDTTHNGGKGSLMATTLIHLSLFSAGPSQHSLILEHLHILHQPFPYPGQALGMGIGFGNTRRCLLQQYYPVPMALPHSGAALTDVDRMWPWSPPPIPNLPFALWSTGPGHSY